MTDDVKKIIQVILKDSSTSNKSLKIISYRRYRFYSFLLKFPLPRFLKRRLKEQVGYYRLTHGYLTPILRRVNYQELSRQLFSVQPMSEGAKANYHVGDEFEAPKFVLPRVGKLKEDE